MRNFDKAYNKILLEFNIEDRNDPSFYDYIVIFLQQLLKRNLIDPEGFDIRKEATDILKKGYYIYTDSDTLHNISYKISFDFDGSTNSLNNLTVRIKDLVDLNKPAKVIDNTFEEESVAEIADYIETSKHESQEPEAAEPEVVSNEVPSGLPGSEPEIPANPAAAGVPQVPNTSQYLKGL